jgi:hypothetical protein
MPDRISDLVCLKPLGASLWFFLGMALAGCAVIEDIHGDGTTTRTFAIAAPVTVSGESNGQAGVVKVTGLGFLASRETTTLGWFDTLKIALDDNCRVVLIGNTDEQLRRFADFLPKGEGLCMAQTLPGGRQ